MYFQLCVFASSQLCTCFRNILCVSASSQCVHVSEMYFVYLLVVCTCFRKVLCVSAGSQLSMCFRNVSCVSIVHKCVSDMYLVYQLPVCFRKVPCVSVVHVFQKCTLCIICPCVSERPGDPRGCSALCLCHRVSGNQKRKLVGEYVLNFSFDFGVFAA